MPKLPSPIIYYQTRQLETYWQFQIMVRSF